MSRLVCCGIICVIWVISGAILCRREEPKRRQWNPVLPGRGTGVVHEWLGRPASDVDPSSDTSDSEAGGTLTGQRHRPGSPGSVPGGRPSSSAQPSTWTAQGWCWTALTATTTTTILFTVCCSMDNDMKEPGWLENLEVGEFYTGRGNHEKSGKFWFACGVLQQLR